MDALSAHECRSALGRSSHVPLWAQIEEFLAVAIDDGRLLPGQRLDSETELAHRFLVSRPTVRHALDSLWRRGLIVRAQDGGTYVAPSP